MADAFEVLKHDHEKVELVLDALSGGPMASTGANPDVLAARKKLTQQLIIDESGHEAIEEQYFWPAVRGRLPNGDQLADQAIGQEQQAKRVLARLDTMDPSDGDFDELLSEFIGAAREHIAFEESKVWPGLRAALTAQEADDLGDKLLKARQSAPTRPHPNTPASPGLLKTAGPAVSAADKLRDAATGRGKHD
jgi:hypothetical protein